MSFSVTIVLASASTFRADAHPRVALTTNSGACQLKQDRCEMVSARNLHISVSDQGGGSLSTLYTPVSAVSSSAEVALVAEPDANPRGVLSRVLRESGYEVAAVANAEQLELALRGTSLLEAPNPVAVLGVGFARRCAGALAAAAAKRARAGLDEISVVLIYEEATLTSVVRPSVGPCNLVAIFEKPLDFNQVGGVVRATSLVHRARAHPAR